MNVLSRFILCFALIFCIMASLPFPCYAAEAELDAMLQSIQDQPDQVSNEGVQSLSDAFYADPVNFVQALAKKDHSVQDTVCRLLANFHTSKAGNSDYIQQLLSLFPEIGSSFTSEDVNTLLTLLLAVDPDLQDAEDDFIQILLSAITYSDGIGADYCAYLMADLFQQDGAMLLDNIAQSDVENQKLALSLLVYGSYDTEKLAQTVTTLSTDKTLTDTQRDLLSQIQAAIPRDTAPVDSAPTDSSAVETTILFTLLLCIAVVVTAIIIYKKKANRSRNRS